MASAAASCIQAVAGDSARTALSTSARAARATSLRPSLPTSSDCTFHETGHALGLHHLRGPAGSQTTASAHYGDSTDIMSWRSSSVSYAEVYRPSGPGLNAPKLHKLGWMPPERVWTRRLETLGPEAIRLARRSVIRGYLLSDGAGHLRRRGDQHLVPREDRLGRGHRLGAHRGSRATLALRRLRERLASLQQLLGLVNARNMVCSAGGTHSALEQFRWLVPAPGSSTSGEVFSPVRKVQMLLRSGARPLCRRRAARGRSGREVCAPAGDRCLGDVRQVRGTGPSSRRQNGLLPGGW